MSGPTGYKARFSDHREEIHEYKTYFSELWLSATGKLPPPVHTLR